jgi:hypothetical protein
VDWNSNLSSKPDNTALIQSYINNNKVVPPGTYYINNSLILNASNFLWGSGVSGSDATVIVAKSSNLDMVRIYDPKYSAPHPDQTKFKIGNIVLQGGKNGIHIDQAGVNYAQIADSVLSNVTMRDMSEAGIFLDGVYGLDNGFWDNFNVINSGAGFKQANCYGTADPSPGINYIDKIFIYRSQFVNNNYGWNLDGTCRPNNMDVCINCLFADNKQAAARLLNSDMIGFYNSDFINNAGSSSAPVIHNVNRDGNWTHGISVIQSRFVAGDTGNSLLKAYLVEVEGSKFDSGGNANAKILEGAFEGIFTNNTSNMSLGNSPVIGVFLNNSIPSGWAYQNIYVENAQKYILSNAASNPWPQALQGSIFNMNY